MRAIHDRRWIRTGPGEKSRIVQCLVFVLSFALQAIAPMPAPAHEAGSLIVICSEAGVAEIRIDAAGNETPGSNSPCHDCENCLACATYAAADLPRGKIWQASGPCPCPEAVVQGSFHASNPAQFWADTCGPPAATKEARTLETIPFMEPAQRRGGTPWT